MNSVCWLYVVSITTVLQVQSLGYNVTYFAGENLYTNVSVANTEVLESNTTLDEKGKTWNNASIGKDDATLEDAQRLHVMLLERYIKYVRPLKKQNDSVNVYIGFSVFVIQEFDEVSERISIAGQFYIFWKDENMIWENDKHAGIEYVFVGYKDVWLPEIILVNPSEKQQSFGQEWHVIRYHLDGWAMWSPGDLIKAKCAIDVRYFPFDNQKCSLHMYAWGYTSNEVTLFPLSNEVNTSFLVEHSSWTLINTTAEAGVEDHVSRIIYTFHLARKPQYVLINVILPILFLCLLNVLVFVLPAESGERVSYSITVLLSLAVFMTIVSNTLPRSSEPLPLISYFLMTELMNSSFISVCTILNLRLYYKSEGMPIPKWMSRFHWLVCMNRTYKRDRKTNKYHCTVQKISSVLNNTAKQQASILDNDSDMNHSLIQTKVATELGGSHALSKTSWKEISEAFDCIFLVFFSVFKVVSFVTFYVIINMQ